MNENASKPVIRIVIVIGLAIAIISLYLLLTMQTSTKPRVGEGSSLKDEVQIGGKFELTDQDGKFFSSESLKGKLSLVYFGFTYCPDICPASLQKLSSVLETLDKYKIDVTPIFITVDPERDTTTVLKEYVGHFHPKFIALTGTLSEIKQVADQFKVYYAKAPSNIDNSYMLDHSSFIYLLDKKGKYLKHFYMNSTPEEIVEFIRVNSN